MKNNTKNTKENKTKELFNKVVQGIDKIISSGEYENFLKFNKKFHNYSFNNQILIYSQNPNATYVAGFKAWQKLERRLKKGAKGIQIMYPIKRIYKEKIEGQSSLNDNEENNEKDIEYYIFRPTYVFDVSQTVGKPIPMEDRRLNANNMNDFFIYLKNFSPYPVYEEDLFRGFTRILEQRKTLYWTK